MSIQRNNYRPASSLDTIQAGKGLITKGQADAGPNKAVSELQSELNAWLKEQGKSGIAVDGLFGKQTDKALRSWQAAQGLKVDGKFGKDSFSAMKGGAKPPADVKPKAVDTQPPVVDAKPKSVDTAPPGDVKPKSAEAKPPAPGPTPTPVESKPPKDAGPVQKTGAVGDGTPSSPLVVKLKGYSQRRGMATGEITLNGNTYKFNSGKPSAFSLPTGNFDITPHYPFRTETWASVKDPGSKKDRFGFSYSITQPGKGYAEGEMSDPRPGARDDKGRANRRDLMRVHPDGPSVKANGYREGDGSAGCMAIAGNASVQRAFQRDLEAELARLGGKLRIKVVAG